jgi:hypothetical protein
MGAPLQTPCCGEACKGLVMVVAAGACPATPRPRRRSRTAAPTGLLRRGLPAPQQCSAPRRSQGRTSQWSPTTPLGMPQGDQGERQGRRKQPAPLLPGTSEDPAAQANAPSAHATQQHPCWPSIHHPTAQCPSHRQAQPTRPLLHHTLPEARGNPGSLWGSRPQPCWPKEQPPLDHPPTTIRAPLSRPSTPAHPPGLAPATNHARDQRPLAETRAQPARGGGTRACLGLRGCLQEAARATARLQRVQDASVTASEKNSVAARMSLHRLHSHRQSIHRA